MPEQVKTETYMGNIFSPGKNLTNRLVQKQANTNIPVLELETARDIARNNNLDHYALCSAGSYLCKKTYINLNRKIPLPIIGKNSEHFFQKINKQRIEATKEDIPKNEFWYAMIGGDTPDKLLKPLEEQKELFNGMKIGAFRSVKMNSLEYQKRLKEVLQFCEQENWPVMVHCSSKNESDLIGVINLAKEHKNVRFCASHLGGDISNQYKYIKKLKKRSANLLNIPSNLFLNNAVKSQRLTQELFNNVENLKNKIVSASDIPFLNQTYEEYTKNIPTEIKKIINSNGNNFLFGK